MNTVDPNSTAWLLIIVLILMSSVIYWIPTVIAFGRRNPDKWYVFLVNFIFGATIIGWVVALVWAFGKIGTKK